MSDHEEPGRDCREEPAERLVGDDQPGDRVHRHDGADVTLGDDLLLIFPGRMSGNVARSPRVGMFGVKL